MADINIPGVSDKYNTSEIVANLMKIERIPLEREQKALEEKNSEISTLKYKLQSTDYVAAKIAEGAATKEEYADILAERESWRQQIRSLEPEVEALLIQVEAQTDGEQSC